jgi:hypothetical protein
MVVHAKNKNSEIFVYLKNIMSAKYLYNIYISLIKIGNIYTVFNVEGKIDMLLLQFCIFSANFSPSVFLKSKKSIIKTHGQAGIVVHNAIPELRRPRQENHEFEASLGYIVRLSLSKRQHKSQENF